jgi:hypothetical protein
LAGASLLGAGLLAQAPAEKAPRAQKIEENKSAPADRPGRAAKLDLTPKSFTGLHALIRPHEDEWRHLKVEWLTDVVAARKKAAQEDKPIVICYTGGAGYNEPLGIC